LVVRGGSTVRDGIEETCSTLLRERLSSPPAFVFRVPIKKPIDLDFATICGVRKIKELGFGINFFVFS